MTGNKVPVKQLNWRNGGSNSDKKTPAYQLYLRGTEE